MSLLSRFHLFVFGLIYVSFKRRNMLAVFKLLFMTHLIGARDKVTQLVFFK